MSDNLAARSQSPPLPPPLEGVLRYPIRYLQEHYPDDATLFRGTGIMLKLLTCISEFIIQGPYQTIDDARGSTHNMWTNWIQWTLQHPATHRSLEYPLSEILAHEFEFDTEYPEYPDPGLINTLWGEVISWQAEDDETRTQMVTRNSQRILQAGMTLLGIESEDDPRYAILMQGYRRDIPSGPMPPLQLIDVADLCERPLPLEEDNEEDIECEMCYLVPRQWVKLKICPHLFCDECVTLWLAEARRNGINNPTCPKCRFNL